MSKPVITPVTEHNTHDESAKTLGQIRQVLGEVPNLFRTVGHSPVALQSLWNQHVAAEQMQLPPRLRAAIGLRVAQLNGCSYCLATHTVLAERADIDAATVLRFRRGQSNDAQEQALLALTTKIVKDHGHHAGFVVEFARQSGVSESEIIAVIALISLHTFTNYINNVANTDLDAHLSVANVDPIETANADIVNTNQKIKED